MQTCVAPALDLRSGATATAARPHVGTAPYRGRVHVAAPLAAAPALASLAARAVPGVEEVDVAAGTVRRLVDLGAGPVPVTVTLTDAGATAAAGSPATPDPAHPPAGTVEVALRRLLARWFGLDDDLHDVHRALGGDPLLGPLLRTRPHLRVLGHPDGFEAAVQAVLTQQVSLRAGRTLGGRLAEAYGRCHPSGLRAYPTPEVVAAAEPVTLQAVLRVPHSRAGAVHAIAVACADGLVLAPGAAIADVRRSLLALRGVGPWTADVVALRALGDRDAYPSGDLVLRRALGVPHARDVAAAGLAWAGRRAWAATHLWASVGYAD